ncbi:MAG: alpha/beta hydrolase [Actinomycetota bacterium]|nr:alpha/beta hydrolase [Actinomycetota bacterium]
MSSTAMTLLELPDGRHLDVLVDGPDIAPTLLFHHGTPGSAAQYRFITGAARALGLRTVTYSRPGYGGSSRHAGRTVADAVPDALAVLDHVGAADCVTAGWSGGGPHALACGSLAPDRVRGVSSMAGVAPYDAADLDFLAGMGAENVQEFEATLAGEQRLREILTPEAEHLGQATPEVIAAEMATLLSASDLAVLSDDFGADLAANFREGLRNGPDGWIDDDLAFVRPWGFDPAAIGVPTSVWQGSEDLMVPYAHGQWLARNVGRATDRAHLLEGEGHLSVIIGSIEAMLTELVAG